MKPLDLYRQIAESTNADYKDFDPVYAELLALADEASDIASSNNSLPELTSIEEHIKQEQEQEYQLRLEEAQAQYNTLIDFLTQQGNQDSLIEYLQDITPQYDTETDTVWLAKPEGEAFELILKNIKSTTLPAIDSFKLNTLNCSSNQLQELPALPDSLTELYCSDNQLQELPDLPDGLTILDCSLNQLQ